MSMATLVNADVLERVGFALADGTRRRILLRLLDNPAYPAELAELLGSSRAGISNHLACLRGCGLVGATREGRQVRYELADPRLAAALRQLTEVVLDSDACPAHLRPSA
jgi:ArsR family transcriptional regulator, cadmium/lead-responsive transcriptional repressor